MKRQGHVVDHAGNGRDGLFLAGAHPYDVMVVDRPLPGLDGLALVKTIRGADINTPCSF
jgi:two-component system OmpR family response regulator